MTNLDLAFDRTARNEAICLTIAAGLHILALIWNPILMKSEFKKVSDFVSVDVVESAGSPPGPAEAPVKRGMFDTIKDMLLTPKTDQIAHVAPEPIRQVAAPTAPTLQEKARRLTPMTFTPQSQNEDLAALKNPDQIQAPGPKVPNMPVGGPTITSKSFGGIRPKDLPFQVSGPDTIATADSSNIPIALGNSSAKSGLGYTGPTLNEKSNRRVGIVPGVSGTGAPNDTMALASAPSQIAIGTGGNGTAPTGAQTGATLQQRGGGLGGRGGSGGGRGTGFGSGLGNGVEGMPGAAQELDSALARGNGGTDKTVKRKGFEISGPLTNRPISYKVIPEYPAWAEEQGIMGSVRLYFTVDAGGNVRTNIRVTKTTGYPALDQLGIDALKKWKFVPLSSGSDEGQWGIITFNFSLSS